MGFKDYSTAANFKSILDRHATKVIQRLRPGETFATVTAMDEANNRCEVVFPGEESPVRLSCGGLLGIELGDTVRIGGEPGRRHVMGVLNPSGLITPTSAAGGDLTGSYPDPEIAESAVDPEHISTEWPACRVRRSSSFSIASGGDQTINWNAEDYDSTGSMHSTVSNTSRIIAPIDGIYHVQANIGLDVVFGTDFAMGTALYYNGSSVVNKVHIVATGAVETWLCVTGDYEMNADDYFITTGSQGSGGNLNVMTGSSFSIRWVRPLVS